MKKFNAKWSNQRKPENYEDERRNQNAIRVRARKEESVKLWKEPLTSSLKAWRLGFRSWWRFGKSRAGESRRTNGWRQRKENATPRNMISNHCRKEFLSIFSPSLLLTQSGFYCGVYHRGDNIIPKPRSSIRDDNAPFTASAHVWLILQQLM